MRRPHLVRVLGLILVLFPTQLLFAQLNRGVLEGIVTDPQGAVMPGANVTVTNVATNVSDTTKTNSAGYYRVESLVPGKYSAHFVISGFSRLDITNVEIRAGSVIRADANMQVGTNVQSVQVNAQPALLETSAANASTILETRMVDEIPLAGRDLQQLVNLMPGVNNVGGPPGSNFGFNSAYGTFPDPTHMLGSDVSVNGGQGGVNAWYLDGNLNLTGFAENVAVNPIPDAVTEFQVITDAFSAEYGRTGGGVFNVVLKSGTNAVHGNLYEFVRNDATNARNPFTSIDQFGNIIKSRQLRFNNFGGTVGGPVVLPHIYNGKNKTFFFFSFDQTILHLLGTKVLSVPTLLQRQGDFSEDPNVVDYGMWDPTTTIGPNANGLFQRTAFGTPVPGNPFGANGCLNTSVDAGVGQTCNFATQIPANRLDPVAMYFIKSFPLPNFNDPLSTCPISADGVTKLCQNFLGTVGSSQNGSNMSIKIDHRWSDKSTYFGELLFNPGLYNNYRVPWTGPTFPYTGWQSGFPVNTAGTIIALGHTYVFSPSLVNEFRASYSRQYESSTPAHPYPDSITGQSQELQVLAPSQLPLNETNPLPDFSFSGPGGSSYGIGPTGYANVRTNTDAFTFIDNLTEVIGRHTLKTGIMYRIDHDAYVSPFSAYMPAPSALVVDPTSGLGASGLTDFMLGAMTGGFAGNWFKPYARSRYWGAYVQDDFHVTSHFTVNIGLRYDVFGMIRLRGSQGPGSRLCLSCTNAAGLKGLIQYWGDPGFPRGSDIWPPNWNDLGPRLNFSWSPFADRKTVFRGGYDIFYTNATTGMNGPGSGSSSSVPGYLTYNYWKSSWTPGCAAFSGECESFPLSDTTTNKANLTTPAYSTVLPGTLRSQEPGGSMYMMQKPSHDPMVQMWNFEMERQLPGNMMISVGYVGSHGTHLMGEPFRSFSYVHTADKLKYKNDLYSDLPITNYYSGAAAQYLGMAYANPATGQPATELPLSILLQQYPQWANTNETTAFDGTGIYHSLVVRVQKHYSNGLNLIAAYTNSKNINNADTSAPGYLVVDTIHTGGVTGGRAGTLANGDFGGTYQDEDNRKADRAVATSDIPQIFNLAAAYELPFGRGKQFLGTANRVLNGVLGGWRLSGNFNAESGIPLSVSCPGNQITTRCNLIGNPNLSKNRTKEQKIADWINPAAFQPAFGGDQSFWGNYDPTDPRAWQFGTADTRIAQLRSPGFWNVDSALAKDFHFTESKYFEFRWEAFNALNHQNLATPNTSFCLPPTASGETDLVHQAGCAFGRITNVATDPRAMEFALKFYW